ncbi:unannotated protein [freshwater metagenome]|uniref:Unannotated protein n=1 Tax=freshwater metagenome TaxID=449393 RepID=A0A6J7L1B6_9ZZZZ
MNAPNAIAKPATQSVVAPVPAPRSRRMSGTATLTMKKSSVTTNSAARRTRRPAVGSDAGPGPAGSAVGGAVVGATADPGPGDAVVDMRPPWSPEGAMPMTSEVMSGRDRVRRGAARRAVVLAPTGGRAGGRGGAGRRTGGALRRRPRPRLL